MIIGVSLVEISIILAALVIASIVYLYLRDRQMISGLKIFLKEGKYKLRIQPPITAPFIYEKLDNLTCYDGWLKPNLPYTLILAIRTTGAGKERLTDYYIGFYLSAPAPAPLSAEWLQGWQNKVAERGDSWAAKAGIEKNENHWGSKGAPDELPIRAARVDGGIILAWNGLHTSEQITARMNDVLASLS